MGFGFRCGFLGMLHMDIVKERLEREYNIQTIFTIPNVVYIVRLKNFKHESVKTGVNIDDLISTGLRKFVVKYKNPDHEVTHEDPQYIRANY